MLLLAVKLAATAGLVAVIAVACIASPPRRCPAGLAGLLGLLSVAACVAGVLTAPAGAPLLALAVVASAGAVWLLRAPPDGGDDGGEPRPDRPPDPDAPDPDAFDWDEFERAGPPANRTRIVGRPGAQGPSFDRTRPLVLSPAALRADRARRPTACPRS